MRVPPAEEILGRGDLHTVESQFAWFKWLGLPADEPGPTGLAVVESAREAARRKLSGSGINPQQPYAVIAPTNEFYTKRWMPDRYARIAESLTARGLQVVLTGAPTSEQIEQLESVQSATTLRLACLSSLNIAELVAAISESRIFVGNDSGPAHMAAALKIPLVVLFGPASSVRWRPWQARAALVQNYFACNPCAMYTCTAFAEPECIRSITTEQVEKAIDSLLVER
jgi:ADP-heptose:LPS heptosyltransferase